MSPVLLCIYIDDLLVKLSCSPVRCYLGLYFVGALAYADDIALIAPTPSAMRKLLAICDGYASAYDTVFNASKSKYVVVTSGRQRTLYRDIGDSVFSIGGKPVEFVNAFTHLGHIIKSNLNDDDDILYRRNCFVGQVNSVLCFFNKLSHLLKYDFSRLIVTVCTDASYGCWIIVALMIFVLRGAIRRYGES